MRKAPNEFIYAVGRENPKVISGVLRITIVQEIRIVLSLGHFVRFLILSSSTSL